MIPCHQVDCPNHGCDFPELSNGEVEVFEGDRIGKPASLWPMPFWIDCFMDPMRRKKSVDGKFESESLVTFIGIGTCWVQSPRSRRVDQEGIRKNCIEIRKTKMLPS